MTVMIERPEQLLTLKVAAERLAISVPSVERLIYRGVLPSLQVPGVRARRILESDLDSFMRAGRGHEVEVDMTATLHPSWNEGA